MIEENAIVHSAEAGLVEVEVQRRSTCGGCSAQGACGVSLLDRLLGRRVQRLIIANTLRARPGETVIIGVPEAALLRAALAAYLWPLLGLLGGAILGHTLGPVLMSAQMSGPIGLMSGPASPLPNGLVLMPSDAASGLLAELPPLLGGALGFAAGLLLLRGYSRRLAADPTYRAVLLRRVTPIAVAQPGAWSNAHTDSQLDARSDVRPDVRSLPRSGPPPGGIHAGIPVKPPAHRG